METLRHAYALAKRNNGAPGIDGVTFEAIEREGTERLLEQFRHELDSGTYRPMRNREKEIPKGGGKVRTMGILTIRDRVVQGALKLILELIFEADFQDGSFGYRPKRSAKEVTRTGPFTHIEYARWADDVVILVDGYRKWDRLLKMVITRLLEELGRLDVQLNRRRAVW